MAMYPCYNSIYPEQAKFCLTVYSLMVEVTLGKLNLAHHQPIHEWAMASVYMYYTNRIILFGCTCCTCMCVCVCVCVCL